MFIVSLILHINKSKKGINYKNKHLTLVKAIVSGDNESFTCTAVISDAPLYRDIFIQSQPYRSMTYILSLTLSPDFSIKLSLSESHYSLIGLKTLRFTLQLKIYSDFA